MLCEADPEAVQALGLKHSLWSANCKSAHVAFLLHGRAGRHDAMRPFLRCIPHDFNLIFIQGYVEDPLGGYSWWPTRGSLENWSEWIEDAKTAAVRVLGFMRASLKYYRLEPRVKLAYGFSQGGALLSLLVQSEPSFLDAVAILAGAIVPLNNSLAQNMIKPRVFVAHGLKDEKLSAQTARSGVRYLKARGFDVTYVEDDVGHKVGAQGLQALSLWTAGL